MSGGPVVTADAALAVYLHLSILVGMGIVTGGTIHFGHPEAFAGRQQTILVTMNVQGGGSGGIVVRRGIIVEGVAGEEGKGGLEFFSES